MNKILNWLTALFTADFLPDRCEPPIKKKYKHLNKEEVKEVKEKLVLGESIQDLAEKYNVSTATIYRIKNGKHKYNVRL